MKGRETYHGKGWELYDQIWFDDCAAVLDTDREKGRDAAIDLMRELFPLTGDLHEMFSPHGYDQMYFDQLEQTRIFLDHLFTLDGAEDAMYAYDPYF